MVGFIEKNRLYIGIVLVLVILVGSGALLWQKKLGNFGAGDNNQELALLKQENDDLKNKIAEIETRLKTTDSGQVKSAVSSQPDSELAQSVSTKININTADEKSLDALSGIGPAKAKAIIDYRDSYGGFKTIQDITKVSGIGQSTFEKIKDKISVD